MRELALTCSDAPTAVAGVAVCEVTLAGIEVQADIGAYSREFGRPQPLRIDVTVVIIPPSEDDLSTTFDYARIRALALELAAQRIALIETFAERLGRRCLEHPSALAVDVRVTKPKAVPGCIAGTRVRFAKDRGLLPR
jgi:dihydroneopterin aldolase